ncbi:hypothetical protein AB0K48_55425, partial [Nonomuraea sp. NPDC055795]
MRTARRRSGPRSGPPGPANRHRRGGRDPAEERQVRLTAQRILAAHLRYQEPPAPRQWQPHPAVTGSRHWPGTDLDLSGATLID